jgi:hypothetical protein
VVAPGNQTRWGGWRREGFAHVAVSSTVVAQCCTVPSRATVYTKYGHERDSQLIHLRECTNRRDSELTEYLQCTCMSVGLKYVLYVHIMYLHVYTVPEKIGHHNFKFYTFN